MTIDRKEKHSRDGKKLWKLWENLTHGAMHKRRYMCWRKPFLNNRQFWLSVITDSNWADFTFSIWPIDKAKYDKMNKLYNILVITTGKTTDSH